MNRTNPPGVPGLSGLQIIHLALFLSFPVVALEQFLRTPPAQFLAQPAVQAEHWVTDSLMMLPLFAAGIWAGDKIANLAGLGLAGRRAVFKRALVIALFAAVALIPVWFERNKKDGLVQAQALTTPHSRGSVDLYWVGSAVILALVCVCLVPAAAWAGRAIAARLPRRGGAALPALLVPVLFVAGAPALAWLLHGAAEHAYASQVNYTSAVESMPVYSHAYFGGHRSRLPAGAPVTAAPFAFAYQAAHAVQDGLAGQAAGLPVAFAALLWGTRGSRGGDQAPAAGQLKEVPT